MSRKECFFSMYDLTGMRIVHDDSSHSKCRTACSCISLSYSNKDASLSQTTATQHSSFAFHHVGCIERGATRKKNTASSESDHILAAR
jgi:hypothetical protein